MVVLVYKNILSVIWMEVSTGWTWPQIWYKTICWSQCFAVADVFAAIFRARIWCTFVCAEMAVLAKGHNFVIGARKILVEDVTQMWKPRYAISTTQTKGTLLLLRIVKIMMPKYKIFLSDSSAYRLVWKDLRRQSNAQSQT